MVNLAHSATRRGLAELPLPANPLAGHPTPVRIADLSEGTEVTVRGTIVPARELATSPGGVECVYWEIAGDRCGGALFWLADDSGRALIDPRDAAVEARAEYRERVIALATAELRDVEDRIRALKQRRAAVGGARASRDNAELKSLRKLATLLCAIRARAHGNVHVGGTLEGQDRYIAERSARFRDAGSEVLRLSEGREVTLGEGDRIEVSGYVSVERVPPDLATGGYREMPTCAHLRAPAGGALRILGLGEAAPLPEELEPIAPEVLAETSTPAARFTWWVIAGVALYGLVRLLWL